MTWPTLQDYNEAIQDPCSAFNDPELKSGQPALTRFGLPKPISGAFASVYQMQCGARRFAVRCFSSEFQDRQSRYRAISDHLERLTLPFIVNFRFLAQGMRIGGRWYPILKMDWVDGDPLHTFVERNLEQPIKLHRLAQKWIDVLTQLRQAQIAHGDLQHGNVLVSNDQIKLIDYDGMYVPRLDGQPSHEEGQRNYQHPARTGRDCGLYLDAFPGWVVLVSLAALAVRPDLWDLLNGGDECLLFRREDFERPAQSNAFHELLAQSELSTLAREMQSFLSLPLPRIRPVDNTVILPGATSTPAPRATRPRWIYEHTTQQTTPDRPDLATSVASLWAEVVRNAWPAFHRPNAHDLIRQRMVPTPLPCVVPARLAPFAPSPEPTWVVRPAPPPEPTLLPSAPLDCVQVSTIRPALPPRPEKYRASPMPPLTMPREPTFVAHRIPPRGSPQAIVGMAVILGLVSTVVGIGLSSVPVTVGGGIDVIVFSIWWHMLETQRPGQWKHDVEKRHEEWMQHCRAERAKWECEKEKRSAEEGRENHQRYAAWQAEVSRIQAVADLENTQRQVLADQENRRRREKWTRQNRPVEIENERRRSVWHREIEEWEKECREVQRQNDCLRAGWEMQNRPARIAWQKMEDARQEKVRLLREERDNRTQRVTAAERLVSAILQEWSQAVDRGHRNFDDAKARLESAKRNVESARSEYDAKLQAIIKAASPSQRDGYLRKHLISERSIPGFGAVLIGQLRSAGIETAADVDALAAMTIHGFGPQRKRALVRWRDHLLKSFRYNPHALASTSEVAQLNAQYTRPINVPLDQLKRGSKNLEASVESTRTALAAISARFEQYSAELAQLEVDLAAVQVAVRQL